MTSWQAWLLNGACRFFMKRHGDKPINLAQIRVRTENPSRHALMVPKGFRIDELCVESGLSFDVADCDEHRADPPATVVLYLHGGGYFHGSPKTHRQIIIAMAKVFERHATVSIIGLRQSIHFLRRLMTRLAPIAGSSNAILERRSFSLAILRAAD